MNWKKEWQNLFWILAIFIFCFYMPVGTERFNKAVIEAFELVKWYAQEHVLLCLIPAFFIAGAIGVFISKDSVMKYLGAGANKIVAYGVASVSGSILAVCSCTILPLFSSIYKMGAGIGPATAFLYSGPAINVLAIVLTASVLGPELGIARGLGAIVFSIVIGLLMELIFKEEKKQALPGLQMAAPPPPEPSRSLAQNGLYFFVMVAILVFANWSAPQSQEGLWAAIFNAKWYITAIFSLIFATLLVIWFSISAYKVILSGILVIAAAFIFQSPLLAFTIGFICLSVITSTAKGEAGAWFASSWGFAKQILPLLLIGVFIAGALLGRVGHEGLIPSEWIASALGGNSFGANLFASVAGAFMYFATLTEIPILQGLIGSGMGKGPALALLLAGPALSLPNMLVIRSVLGTKKTIVFICLVVVMATISGMVFGSLF